MSQIKNFIGMWLRKYFVEKPKVTGVLKLELRGPDGGLKDSREYRNTITEVHDATIADRMTGGADALIGFTGVGSGSGGKSTVSTALEAQLARVADDSDTQGAGGNDNDTIHVSTFPAGTGTGAITEAGLFTTLATATLHAWQDFAAVNKGAADALTVTWTITYGAS